MTIANPLTIALWLSIAASFSATGERGDYPLVRLAGVASGALAWVAFIVSVIHWARRWVTPLFLRGVNLVSGTLLIIYGVKFWIDAISL